VPGRDDAADERPAEHAALLGDFGEPLDGERALFVREVAGRRRERGVGEAEVAVDGDGEGDQEVDDEEPPEAFEAGAAVEVGFDGALHDAAEEGAGQTGGCEDCGALANLRGFVP